MKFASTFNHSLLDAVRYYAAIDKSLGRRLYQALDEAIDKIDDFPKIGVQRRTYRVLSVRGFPYSICYELRSNGPVALVLHHQKKAELKITG
jgi:plasmid stabilization system protein ParE